jgi:hypothetical protein
LNNDPLEYEWTGFFSEGSASGSTPEVVFTEIGKSEVTLIVDDGKGDDAICTSSVDVEDTKPPSLTPPGDIQIECISFDGTTVNLGNPAISDLCDEYVAATNDAPLSFPIGQTIVNWTATDESGNTSTETQLVGVVDTIPPEFSLSVEPSVLWPPNHKMVPVAVTVMATDKCDSEPFCKIISIASNEPVNGFGDGNTATDWVITGDLNVKLRAERSGKSNGRTYNMTVECTDQSGNSSTQTATVGVPHDKDKKKK